MFSGNTVLFADKLFLSEKWNSSSLSEFHSSLQNPEFCNKPSQFVKFVTVDKLDINDPNQRKSKKRKNSRRGIDDSEQIIKRVKHEKGIIFMDSEESEPRPVDTVDRKGPKLEGKSSHGAGVSDAQEAPPVILPCQVSLDVLLGSMKQKKCRRKLNFNSPTISGREKVRNIKQTGEAPGSGATADVF